MSAPAYREYMSSPEWRAMREMVMQRAGGICEHCGKDAEHVHHVRYPKVYAEDHPDNLIAVCAACHDLHHGAKPMTAATLTDWSNTQLETPDGRRVTVIGTDGGVFADSITWMDAMRVPKSARDIVSAKIAMYGATMTRPGFCFQAQLNGTLVYRWDVIDQSLMFWYVEHRRSSTPQPGARHVSQSERRELDQFADALAEMRFHFRRQQEAAWLGRLQGKKAPEPVHAVPEWVVQLTRQLGETVIETKRDVAAQGERVSKLEAVVLRKRDEWITVKEGCRECFVDESMIVHGRENLGSHVGRLLGQHNRPKGPTKTTRIDGSGLTVRVNQWRREDVYKGIKHACGKDCTGLLD